MVVLSVRGNKAALWLGGVSVALYAAVGQLARGPEDTPLWLCGYALAWGLYLGLFLVRARDDFVATPAVILLWALVSRLVLVPTEPWLSDDLYRYLLDGRVFESGINPFRYAPANEVIRSLHPDLVAKVNHPEVPTIYPPTVQGFGLVAAWLNLGVTGWRLLMTLVDLAVIGAVSRLFGRGPRGWRAAAVYGLCPLAIWETGANGHLEPLAALPLIVGAHLWRRRGVASGVVWGLAVLAKYYPLVILPAWIREKGFARVAGVAALVSLAGLLPFTRGGVDVFAGMKTYLAHWSFNSPLHAALERWIGERELLRAMPYAVVLVGGVIAGIRREDPRRAAPMLLFALLVLGPTLQPWYALWVLPWLGDRPHPGLWSFVAAMGGAYAVWWQVARTGEWALPPGVAILLWGTVALGWLAAFWQDPGESGETA
jgi:hypothetical protein